MYVEFLRFRESNGKLREGNASRGRKKGVSDFPGVCHDTKVAGPEILGNSWEREKGGDVCHRGSKWGSGRDAYT